MLLRLIAVRAGGKRAGLNPQEIADDKYCTLLREKETPGLCIDNGQRKRKMSGTGEGFADTYLGREEREKRLAVK